MPIRQKITNLLISSLTLMLLLWIHDSTHIYARKRHDFRSGSNEYVLGGNLLLSSIALTNRHFIWPCDTTKAMNLSHLAQKYTLYHHILLSKVLSIKCTIIITVVALCCYQYDRTCTVYIQERHCWSIIVECFTIMTATWHLLWTFSFTTANIFSQELVNLSVLWQFTYLCHMNILLINHPVVFKQAVIKISDCFNHYF